jgi:hypothetical protein
MGFTYGGSGEPAGPFIAFGGLSGNIDYSCQLVGAYSGGGNDFKIRTRNDDAGAWNAWRTILTDGNYTSYSPSLTGGGASGTWGINVTGSSGSCSGNAATATNLSNLGTVTLATATEANAIYITQPGYTTDQPVKLLNFEWYGNLFSLGNIRSGGTPSSGFGLFYTAFGGSRSELARMDTSGRMLMGTTTYINGWNTSQKLIISGTGAEGIGVFTTSSPGIFVMTRSGGTNPASFGLIGSDARLGILTFNGGDGTDRVTAARIQAVTDGTPSAGFMPGRIEFMTTSPSGALTEALRITTDRVIAYNQSTPTSKNAAATLTIAELKIGIIQYTGAAATLTLPTGTLSEAGFIGIYNNITFEWSVINTGSGLCTIGAGTGHTIIGGANIAAGASGRFATRRTAANTFISYRLS